MIKLVTFRCDNCGYYEGGFCSKLGELVHNSLAKLFFGGAFELFSEIGQLLGECRVDEDGLTGNYGMEVVVVEGSVSLRQQL